MRIDPFTMEVFGGKMRFAGRVTSDNMDTNKINTWAEGLGEKLSARQLKCT